MPLPFGGGAGATWEGGTARAAVRPPEAAACRLPLELFEEDEVPLIFHADEKSFKVSQGGLPNRFYVMWKKGCGSIGMPDLRPKSDLRRRPRTDGDSWPFREHGRNADKKAR